MELDSVGAYLARETVLVTGAGGSIGAELCRQIAHVGPRRIVLLDHAEDNLFEIQRELEDERHVPAGDARGGAGGLQGGRAHARGLRRAPPDGGLPRGGLQARGADGVRTRSRRCTTTRSRRASWRRSPASWGVQALRARLDRQGGRAGDGDGGVEGARGVRAGGRGGALPGDRSTRRCASATCSAPRAAWCRSSAARSRAAGR